MEHVAKKKAILASAGHHPTCPLVETMNGLILPIPIWEGLLTVDPQYYLKEKTSLKAAEEIWKMEEALVMMNIQFQEGMEVQDK